MRPSAASALPVTSVADLEAKLGCAEFLLNSIDLQASARYAVDWLADHVGIRQAIVALIEPAGPHLVLVAEHGLATAAVADFYISLDEPSHPFVRAMNGSDAVFAAVAAAEWARQGFPQDLPTGRGA